MEATATLAVDHVEALGGPRALSHELVDQGRGPEATPASRQPVFGADVGGGHQLAVELQPGGLAPGGVAQRWQALWREAGRVRGIAQPLDLLAQKRGGAVAVSGYVADDAPSAEPHHPRHLRHDPRRPRNVVQAEAGDRPVEGG